MSIEAFNHFLFDLAVPHDPAPLRLNPGSSAVPDKAGASRTEHRCQAAARPRAGIAQGDAATYSDAPPHGGASA